MKKNASDLAYKFIKARIVEQEYPQDSQLKEIAIAKELGVTRTPVREALIKLAGEGIVRIIHNRGAFVISLSKREIEDLYEVREALELVAIQLAYRRASMEEIEKVREGILQRQQLVNEHMSLNYFNQIQDFHSELIRLSKNDKMISIWNTLDSQMSLARATSTRMGKRCLDALKEHGEILSSLTGRNCEEAERLLKAHINKSKENLLRHCHASEAAS